MNIAQILFLNFLGFRSGAVNSLYGHGKIPKPSKTYKRTTNTKPHQGEGEKRRRRRQIEKGMITLSNGLQLKRIK